MAEKYRTCMVMDMLRSLHRNYRLCVLALVVSNFVLELPALHSQPLFHFRLVFMMNETILDRQ